MDQREETVKAMPRSITTSSGHLYPGVVAMVPDVATSLTAFAAANYRLIITAILWSHIVFRYSLAEVNVGLLWTTCAYSAYVLSVHGFLKRAVTYPTIHNRILRTILDTSFALLFIFFTRGVDSSAFGLLLVPAFFASYRYSGKAASVVVSLMSASYVAVCLLVANNPEITFFTKVTSNLCILVFLWFSNWYSRVVLLERMRSADSASDINPREAELWTLTEKTRAALRAQACLLFTIEQGRYTLAMYATRHAHDGGRNHASSEHTPPIILSEQAIDQIKQTKSLRIGSSENSTWVFSMPPKDVAKAVSLGTTPIVSLMGTSFHSPYDNAEHVIVAVNKMTLRARKTGEPYVEDFRREDEYLLGFIIDRMFSRLLLHLLRTDAQIFRSILDEGVADEVCSIDSSYDTTLINKVKRTFFNLPGSPLGQKCHWLYHRREAPCEQCKSLEAFHTDAIVPWEKSYNHPVTGRPYIASIKAKRVLNRRGQYEVVETVHDVTNDRRYAVLTDFVLSLQQDSMPVDEQSFARRVATLFGALGFERARLYEYEADRERFVFLSSYGHSNPPAYRRFTFKIAGDQVSEWVQGGNDGSWMPVVVRLAKTRLDPSFNNTLPNYEIRYVDSFPHETLLKKEAVTEQLDLPIVYGGKMLGKLSIDNYSEQAQREIFRFDDSDVVIAHVCSRIIGYAWESARKESFDDYIKALEHEILEPLHIIAGHADYVLRYFDESSIPRERKRLKLTDIIQHVTLVSLVVRGARIEKIRREDYVIEEVDFFKDIVLKAIAHIRDYYAPKNKIDIQHSETCIVPTLCVDRAKFELVLYNLLINAVKYADRGSLVQVKTSVQAGCYRFDIEDQGIAIREEEEEKIFRKFYRAPSGTDRDPGGTGLGLFVAKLVVENHGGRLYVSQRENPTTFTITLPMDLSSKGG